MKNWLKILMIILIFAVVSIALFLILKAFNITSISQIRSIIEKTGNYGAIVFIIIQTLMLVAFCFVPILNTALIGLGIILFGSKIAFLTCIVSIFFSSSILFFIGDKFGEGLARLIVGKDELNRLQNIIDTKSKLLLPILFFIPGIPDEALCLISGMTKIKYWYFILVSLTYHAIEIFALCFLGSGLIDFTLFTIADWIIVINLIIIDVYLILKLEKFLNNKINKKP